MATRKKTRAPLWKKILWRTLVTLLLLSGLAVSGIAGLFYYLSLDLPPIGPLLQGYDPPQSSRILAADGTLIGEFFEERRTVVSVDRLPPVLLNAVVSAEDGDFWNHRGIDYYGILRASVANVKTGGIAQGASTITQQVARTFFLTRKRSFARKIREMLLTKKIEEELTKEEILFLYLNQINFGHARYGVGEAARFYFDKQVEDLILEEAALLAAIPKGPAVYEPLRNPERARGRRAYVLERMFRDGHIPQEEMERAVTSPLGLQITPQNRVELVPEAVSRVISELDSVMTMEALRRGGYTIWTRLDMDLQRNTRKSLLEGLIRIDTRHTRVAPFRKRPWPRGRDRGEGRLRMEKTYITEVVGHDDEAGLVRVRLGDREGNLPAESQRYNPKELPASQMAEIGAKLPVLLEELPQEGKPLRVRLAMGPQGAVVVMCPQTGMILAMVGGDEPRPGGFNRATQALRQPGSAFKPFVFLEAIRTRRFTAASLLDDSPEVEGDWIPDNAHGKELLGLVSMRHALAHSLNLPAIKLIREVTPERVAELVGMLGISSTMDPSPALALGTSAVTPLDLTTAYATIAGGGVRRGPWLVQRVTRPDGQEVSLLGRIGTEVISPEEAYLITSLLTSVVTRGTGSAARKLKMPLAGKTGTTNDVKDAWFAGFSSSRVAVVWVGYDEPRTIGRREYGGVAALPIWMDVMRLVHADERPKPFDAPEGIVTVLIDPATGLLAYEGMEKPVEEVFIEGTQPEEHALPPEVVSLDEFMVQQMDIMALLASDTPLDSDEQGAGKISGKSTETSERPDNAVENTDESE